MTPATPATQLQQQQISGDHALAAAGEQQMTSLVQFLFENALVVLISHVLLYLSPTKRDQHPKKLRDEIQGELEGLLTRFHKFKKPKEHLDIPAQMLLLLERPTELLAKLFE